MAGRFYDDAMRRKRSNIISMSAFALVAFVLMMFIGAWMIWSAMP